MNKEQLNKIIERMGFFEAANFLGIKSYELFYKSGYKINDPKMLYEITLQLFIDKVIPTEYKKFSITVDMMEGSIFWLNDEREYEMGAYATPFWDGNPNLPINFGHYIQKHPIYDVWESEIAENFVTFKIETNFKTFEELLNWFKEYYYPVVYNTIMTIFLPQAEEYVEKNTEIDEN